MSEERRSPVRWLALGALAVAAAATFVLTRKAEPPPPAAPSEVVTQTASVALFDDGAPMAGRVVVFHASDGRILGTKKSGADGKATGPMQPGGMITVAYGSSLQRLVTIASVEPNDEVLVGERDNDEANAGDTSAIARVTLPGPYARAARYGVALGVGENSMLDAGAPLRLPVMRRYLDEQRRFHVLGLAYDADGGTLAYAHGETTAAEAGDTDVKLATWKSDFREQRLRLLHPRGLTSVKADFFVHVGEARFDHRVHSALGDPDTNLALDVPRTLGESATYRIEVATAGADSDRAILVERDAKMPPLVLLDLAEVPRVSNAAVESAARPALRWKVDGDRSKAHASVLQLSWPETKEHVWTVIAPPATTSPFRFPALPDELASWRPPEDGVKVRPGVALVEASEYTGFADVKKKWIHVLGELPEEDGTLRLSLTGEIDL